MSPQYCSILSNFAFHIFRRTRVCVHIQMCVCGKGIPKSGAVTTSCRLWVHTPTSKERNDDSILLSKSLPGEGTHEGKSSRRTYLQKARREYHGKLKSYNGRRGISHQRLQEIRKVNCGQRFRVGWKWLGKAEEALLSSGPSGSVWLKERSQERDTAQHALGFTLNLDRCHQRWTATSGAPHPTSFLLCANTEEKEGHWKLRKYKDSPEIYQWIDSQWIHSPCQGKERASELSVNPQTVTFHICHDKLQRCLLALKQIQTNSGRTKQSGKKNLAWPLQKVTNNNQVVLQKSIKAAINR